ncbi:MAG: DUF2442 domain-containing protein [Paludibacter sp.]|nr:DUF2442 domain-containing protein [Paludibacter sp.]
MYLAVKNVQPLSNYQLILTFANVEKRQFDMNPYLETGIFKELQDITLFNSVRVSFDTIEWENGADMDPEILYQESTVIENQIASEPMIDYGLDK